MLLYHGSNTPDLQTLTPRQADHDKPYLYMSTSKIIAGFYLINAVERPYYWFPYGFEKDGTPHYHEWYPNALQEVAKGTTGYIYTVDIKEEATLPLANIPCARLCTRSVPVVNCLKISDCYQWFLDHLQAGSFVLKKYETKTPEEISFFEQQVLADLCRQNMRANPDCSYAKFIQDKFPIVWNEYLLSGK